MPATTPAKLLARMADLSLQSPEKDFIGCLYGPTGSGKSTLVAGLGQQLKGSGRILYVDSSDGWVSLENFPGLTDDMVRLQFGGVADLMGIADALSKRSAGFEDFTVVILDEYTSMSDATLNEVVKERSGSFDGAVEGSDYRPMAALMVTALNRLHEIAGLHVILVAHDRQDIDHRKVTLTSPGFSPKLAKQIAQKMHVIGYVQASIKGTVSNPEYVREVQAQPTALISAKSRIGGMPLKVEFFDFIEQVAGWVGGNMSAELAQPEAQIEAAPDELPTEGVELPDNPEDDEPAYVEEA